MKRFLVTTEDERTWRHDRPVLFLGEWCRRLDRRGAWERLDAEVVPYHWDDRERCCRDYQYLQALHEDMICRVAGALNAHHRTEHSLRYWRILVGPWLYLFTHVLFDRWTMVKKASDAYDIGGTLILRESAADLIPSNLRMVDPDSVRWSHFLSGKAIKHQNRIPWTELPIPAGHRADGPSSPSSQRMRATRISLRRAIHAIVSPVQRLLTKDDEAMIIETYLAPLQELMLQVALRQVPKRWKLPEVASVPPDLSVRSELRISSDASDPFRQFLAAMIPEQIPTVYLEGYDDLRTAAAALPWPRTPSVIFTSNLFQFCEPFQAWAAERVEANVPFVIGQHGGQYGVAKWIPAEDHQVAVADRFVTWGWVDHRPSVYRGLVLTNLGKPLRTWKNRGTLLLVTTSVRPQGYRCNAWPAGANQARSFLAEQMRFVEALAGEVRGSLVLRLSKSQDRRMRAGFFEQLSRTFPDVQMDDSRKPIESRIRRCRVFAYACNSTGFLETLARDIPTVLFWSPAYFELRQAAQPYFDRLKAVRIFHDTPESAAAHVNRIWSDVAAWWHDSDVQDARREFCARYAHMPQDPIRFLRDALQTIGRAS